MKCLYIYYYYLYLQSGIKYLRKVDFLKTGPLIQTQFDIEIKKIAEPLKLIYKILNIIHLFVALLLESGKFIIFFVD